VNDGARHLIVPGVLMGLLIDAEPDGQPTMLADGDDMNNLDDEDGVFFNTLLIAGQTAQLEVLVSVDGYLDAWFDWNQNGTWIDAGEHVLMTYPVTQGLNNIVLNIPAAAVSGDTYSRFRFRTNNMPIDYFGFVDNGEVEDYIVHIHVLGDANGDGSIDVLDVVMLIDYLLEGDPEGFNPVNADANGDGVIDILDAVWIIDAILNSGIKFNTNSQPADIYLTPESIMLESDGTLSALQFEVGGFESGLEVVSMLPDGFELVYRLVGDRLIAVVINLQNKPIPAGLVMLVKLNQSSKSGWGDVVAANLNAEKVEVRKHYYETTNSMSIYPNPSHQQFNMAVTLGAKSVVRIELYDMTGRKLQDVFNGILDQGNHQLQHTHKLVPGVYFVRMIAGDVDEKAEKEVITKRIVIME
jgi:hypothetical protein